MPSVPQEAISADMSEEVQGPSEGKTYRINTECELIYGLSYGVYPNDQKIAGVEIQTMMEKYPEEFEDWEKILEDPEQRTAFFNQPLDEEFGNVLVTAMMKEISINPDLKDIALLITDPNGREKLADDFEEFGCQRYFDSRIQ